jgi:aminomethyltransferase
VTTASDDLKELPLHHRHVELGGKMVEFAGFQMPLQYTGILDEHKAVRERVGLFDVTHMGEVFLEGSGALETIQRVTANDASRLEEGQAQYSVLLTEGGTIVDDLLVYRLPAGRWMLVPNASNRDKDFRWVSEHAAEDTSLLNASDDWVLIALQGPRAVAVLSAVTDLDLEGLRVFRHADAVVAGRPCLVSRTGYTGEDGFEIYIETDGAAPLWDGLLEAGRDEGILPCGLGARDLLRLEAGLCLYGNDIDETTTPIEAGLGWLVKLGKGEFLGRDVLARQKEEGPSRKLCGFRVTGKGIARPGHPVLAGGKRVGQVTSGTHSPSVGSPIGMAYLPAEHAAPETPIEVMVRNRPIPCEVVKLPFYRAEKG